MFTPDPKTEFKPEYDSDNQSVVPGVETAYHLAELILKNGVVEAYMSAAPGGKFESRSMMFARRDFGVSVHSADKNATPTTIERDYIYYNFGFFGGRLYQFRSGGDLMIYGEVEQSEEEMKLWTVFLKQVGIAINAILTKPKRLAAAQPGRVRLRLRQSVEA